MNLRARGIHGRKEKGKFYNYIIILNIKYILRESIRGVYFKSVMASKHDGSNL